MPCLFKLMQSGAYEVGLYCGLVGLYCGDVGLYCGLQHTQTREWRHVSGAGERAE